MITKYTMAPAILDWVTEALIPLEKAVFDHCRGIASLVHVVEQAEAGTMNRYAALSAIQRYNKNHGTEISYEQVRIQDRNLFVPDLYPEGDPVVFVDDLRASNELLLCDAADFFEAVFQRRCDSKWILLWLPATSEVYLPRSPYWAYCGEEKDGDFVYANGDVRGKLEAPSLPPEIVASIPQVSFSEINHNRQAINWR